MNSAWVAGVLGTLFLADGLLNGQLYREILGAVTLAIALTTPFLIRYKNRTGTPLLDVPTAADERYGSLWKSFWDPDK